MSSKSSSNLKDAASTRDLIESLKKRAALDALVEQEGDGSSAAAKCQSNDRVPGDTSRSRRQSTRGTSLELLAHLEVPEITEEPTALDRNADLRRRIQRLHDHICCKKIDCSVTPFWTNEDPDRNYDTIRRLLRIPDERGQKPDALGEKDVSRILEELCSEYPNVDKSWIQHVCRSLARCESYQQQIVFFSRSVHSILSNGALSKLEAGELSALDAADVFGTEEALLTLQEKIAVILENERRLNHVADLCTKLHLMAGTKSFLDAYGRLASSGGLAGLKGRLENVEKRLVNLASGVVQLDSKLSGVVKRIVDFNNAFSLEKEITI